jgi:hypothetical protein
MLFNVGFVGAAGIAALMLPPDGRSAPLVGLVAGTYAGVAVMLMRWRRTEELS